MANPKRILKRFLRILAVLMAIPLVLVILLVAVPFAGSIGLQQEALPPDASVTLRRAHAGERWMLGAGRILDRLTGMPKDLPDAASYHSEHFYPGGESAGETWHLGYAQAVITPEDWETKAYYEGGNISIPARRLTAKLDELKVRAIALSTGEGVHIFAAVDSLGVANKQVQQIRALVADMGLQSVNIAATHTHSAVDTIGFYSKGGNVDLDYLAFMNEKTAGAIRAAVAALEPGKLYISQIGATSMEDYDRRLWEKVGIDWEKDEWNDEWGEKYDRVYEEMLAEVSIAEYGLGDYIRNRRTPWAAYPTRLTKLRFVPLNPESQETALVNFAAHAYTAGLKLPQWAADSISGDFPYYMEEVFNEVGANFVYFGGAANAVYPQRQRAG